MAVAYRPDYLALYESGELEERVQALEKMLLSCNICPLDCGNNRIENQNAIVSNGGDGIFVESGTENTFQANSIWENAGLGIDLAPDGFNANDPQDADTGANNRQNYPLLTGAIRTGSTQTVGGTLNSTPDRSFTIDFYQTEGYPPSGVGTGAHYSGAVTVTTDGNGDATFSVHPEFNIGTLQVVATATDADGNTSEFSPCHPVTHCTPGQIQFTGAAYTATSATVSYADGETGTKTVIIPITNDSLYEGSETVNLTLTATTLDTPPAQGAPVQFAAALTITDDDVPPAMGNYPAASIPLSGDATVAPDAEPTGAKSITVLAPTDFKGSLEGDPTTGVVRVTNAHPAGDFTVTVAKTLSLLTTARTTYRSCLATGLAASVPPTTFGTAFGPLSVAIGDFNGDGRQDLAVAVINSDCVSVLLRECDTTPPPAPTITSHPPDPGDSSDASFGFSDAEAVTTFLCQLDGSNFAPCSSPQTYGGLADGSHTFSVKARDAAGNESAATPFVWTIATAQFPQGGAFIIGDRVNLSVGSTVYFWGSQWANNNPMTGGAAPSSFKGFEDGTRPTACGGNWMSRPGDSSHPPSSIPRFMTVLVSDLVQKSGSTLTGHIKKVVVVETGVGYGPSPSQPGTGRVISISCPAQPANLLQNPPLSYIGVWLPRRYSS